MATEYEIVGDIDLAFSFFDRGRAFGPVPSMEGIEQTRRYGRGLTSGVGRVSTLGVRVSENIGPGFGAFVEWRYGLAPDRGKLLRSPEFALDHPPAFAFDRCSDRGVGPTSSNPQVVSTNKTPFADGLYRAIVGLRSPVGRFSFGRDRTPSIELLGRLDQFQLDGWGSLSSLASAITPFDCNAVRFRSRAVNGLRVDSMMTLGEGQLGRRYIIARDAVLSYSFGPVFFGLGYREEKYDRPAVVSRFLGSGGASLPSLPGGPVVTRSKIAGLSVSLKGVTVSVPFASTREPLAGQTMTTYGLGLSYQYGRTRFSVQYARHKPAGDGRVSVYGFKVSRFLPRSRRAQFYVSVGRLKNATGSERVLSAANAALLVDRHARGTAASIGFSYSFGATFSRMRSQLPSVRLPRIRDTPWSAPSELPEGVDYWIHDPDDRLVGSVFDESEDSVGLGVRP